MTDKIVVMTTCDSGELAEQIGQHLVERRLAACVEILPGARSIYRWGGKIEDAHEWVLVIKTRRDRFEALRDAILKKHSYDVPELIALPVVDGSAAYLSWIDQEVG
jgi:periplasmic divalent cation tolerance protein